MKLDNTTAAAVFRSLTERNPDACGSYDAATHSLTVFLAVKGVLDFAEWRKRSERVRRIATMTEASVLPGHWVRDPSKPTLVDRPTFAVTYDSKTARFLPCINIAVVTIGDFAKAQAEAVNAASECNLWQERHGRLPSSGDLTEAVTIFYPTATAGMNGDPAIQDLLSRINESGGANTAAGSASGRGTSQNKHPSFSGQRSMQAHDPDRYHKRIRT